MDDFYEIIECLCNSPQRLKILDVLIDTWMDVREVMEELDSPRSTIQRNLSVLEDRGWVETAGSRYTTTTVGELLRVEFTRTGETAIKIERMAPFLTTADISAEVAIDQLNQVSVTTPEPTRPHSPRKRLLGIFEEADCVRGFLPVVSSLSVEEAYRADADSKPDGMFIISSAAYDALHDQYADEDVDGGEIDPFDRIDIRVHDGDLPYGLFVSDDALALAAYDEIGRIEAVVESTSKETIEWGERKYKEYVRRSTQPYETATPSVAGDGEQAE